MGKEDKKRKHTTFKDEDEDEYDQDSGGEENDNDNQQKKEDVDVTDVTDVTDAADQEQQEGGEGEGEKTSKRKRKRKRKKKNSGGNNNNEGENGTNTNGADSHTSKDGGGGGDAVGDKLNSLEHTVYVEGIPFDCTEEEVKGFFVDNGCDDVLQMRLPRWQDSGRLRGYGHIVFDSTKSRAKALSDLNGLNLKRRYLTIQEAKPQGRGGGGGSGGRQSFNNSGPRAQPDNCRTVFVKNLPYNNITEDDLQLVFRSCGKIVDGGVRLARNYQTKQLKGFGYIEFKNPEGAYAAVQRASKADGIKVGGRMCYVDYEESSMKGSFRTSEGKLWQKQHGSVHNT